MNTSSPTKPSEAASTPGDLYNEAIRKEGLQASPELVERVRVMHANTLTPGLVMRAFAAHRQARLREQHTKGTTATQSRS